MTLIILILSTNFAIEEVREVEIGSRDACISIAEDINRRFQDRVAYCE